MAKETPQPLSKQQPETEDQQEEMVEIPVSEANHSQLIWFCKQQGYEYSDADTQHQTYSRVKSAWEHATITVPKVVAVDSPPEKPRPATDYSSSERNGLPPYVKIKILSIGDDQAQDALLAHNGIAYRIQVGEVVRIPWYVYQGCILDAQQIRYRSDTEAGLGEPIYTQAVSFTRVE
jgi:hypothetical protein